MSVGIASYIIVSMTACEAKGPQTVRDVESFINETLPIGSDRSRVVQVLTERGIENSGAQTASGIVYAIIRDVSGWPLIRGSITMRFFFDDRGILVRYEVRKVFTGP